MGVTGSSLDFKHTLIDGQERNIECSSSQIEDKDVSFTITLLVETISNGSGSWLIDDSENVNTSN